MPEEINYIQDIRITQETEEDRVQRKPEEQRKDNETLNSHK
jgi:hypothetical protein